MAIEFNDSNFDAEVLNSDLPVLVDFWATWCPPCRALSPVIDELAGDLEGNAKVGKLNIDEAQEIAVKYAVNSIPTVLVFKSGEVVNRIVGAKSKETYVDAMNTASS